MNDDRYMGSSHMLNPLNNCYFNLDFVYDEIPNRLIPFDYETFAAYSGTVEAVVTDVDAGRAAYLTVPSGMTNLWRCGPPAPFLCCSPSLRRRA